MINDDNTRHGRRRAFGRPRPRWFAFALTALPLLLAAGDSTAPAPDPDPQRFADAIKAFERWDAKNAWPRDAILFAGSSSIVMWHSREAFPDWPVINRGFGGSHISDVNHFFDQVVAPYAPRVVVFYCGDNDIASGKTPQQVLEDYQEFVSKVHAAAPQARIVYLPIKPSVARWKLWPQMQETNALIRDDIAKDPLQSYLDTATPMLGEDGAPRTELLLKDGLHMSDAGYRLWNDALKSHVEKVLSEPQKK